MCPYNFAVTVARVLGTLGKTVIAIGLIILLFGIFQLWGTGVFEAQAQKGLDDEFSDLLEASTALDPPPEAAIVPAAPIDPEPTAETPATAEPTAGPTTAESNPVSESTPTVAPTATPEPAEIPRLSDEPHPEWLAMLYRDQGSAIARIQIPRINIDKTVVEGVRVSDLRKGPGHYPTTAFPGQEGNAAIAGHRTTYGAPFGEIDKLLPGDEIVVTTIQGQFTYQVLEQGEGHGHLIVPPTAVEVLDQNFRDNPNRLTLTACHPKGSARQRIIVVAELLNEPAPTYPRPRLEELAEPQLADEILDEAEVSEQTVTATPAPVPAEETELIDEAATVPEPTDDEQTPTPRPSPNEALPEPTPADETDETASGLNGLPRDSGSGGAGPPDPASPANNPPPAADSFGEGLDGDSDALVPAILWGLAALAIWFSAIFAGHRWRRLPTYALFSLPFLVVMFMAFWHIDRILPSY